MANLTMDPLFYALMESPTLDDLRLSVQSERVLLLPLVSTKALADLLLVKKRWWRLALKGMGLQDEHCYIIAQMLSRDDTCRVRELLSLEFNPLIGQKGYQELFRVFFKKHGMGPIKVDDKHSEAEVDLMRSMNNLYLRIHYAREVAHSSLVIHGLSGLPN